ncbi:Na+/H+ antiporter NhaA [Magnetospira sp. QH-2]|uniref:Na+/H+ antiporter NhaA n=1 Tax=Magnetospira sp. (strain QH-2) TaxID=1288970 RepID=UPI0003E80E0D|nr:Na+/H+ antiporter NhaA [Magnetospira sp. QH-2]CCQ72206.1 Na(+)/H(+) antiporter nhaA [Magnetospira sp. QH-2]
MTQASIDGRTTFLSKESAGGLALMAAAVAALLVSNSPLAGAYGSLLELPVTVSIGALGIDKPLLLWVNDGLMAIFFFLVGLELKREVLEGRLSSFDRASLPFIAAVGGMLVPALIYLAINSGTPENAVGWAIPAATDIAFALGILALMGPSVPVALKVFLLGIAIIDDLGAIIAIALFYTDNLSWQSLVLGGVGLATLAAMNRFGVKRIAPYALIGLLVWVGVLKSGVHATLAGVLVALTIPMRDNAGKAILEKVEHGLHPWVGFFIMPVFAFANAGVSLAGLSLTQLMAPLPLGIALGLFVGKQVGVMGFTWLGVKSGLCRLPDGMGWKEVYGVACLTGIGFTMSLFIGTLAFESPEQLNAVRMGVVIASVLSGCLGTIVLRRVLAQTTRLPRGAVTSL